LCGKLLEETRREENNSQHEALLITKARKKYFGTYYKGSRMASKRRPNAKLQPHESPRRIKDNEGEETATVVVNGATSSENAHIKTGRETLTIDLGS
jgi:hypothetical protein